MHPKEANGSIRGFHNHQKLETTKHPCAGGWINKPWGIRAVEYYAAVKKTMAAHARWTGVTAQL